MYPNNELCYKQVNTSYIPLQRHTMKYPPQRGSFLKRNKTQMIVLFILLFGLNLLIINIYQLHTMKLEHRAHHMGSSGPYVEAQASDINDRQLIVWVHGKKVDSGYLKHVFNVFERIGYTRGTADSDWDVLWCHEYPFTTLKDNLSKLKPHQRVNHFPGSGFVTNKVNLVTAGIDSPFIPKAFKMPQQKTEFLQFAERHPEKQWVQKANNHRGVVIAKVDKLNLNADNSFIQEYIDNPYLIDKRRFDIGIYTTLTSVDPLRLYINEGEWLVRFCPDEYYPFDPTNKNKYVISDDYKPPWEIPSIGRYFTSMGYTRRESLLAHLRSEGQNTDLLLRNLHEAIRMVYLEREYKLINSLSKFSSRRSFFELVRFDFIVDKDLNVFLLEVNMSPNLSSGHFPPNKLLYEHVLFGMFNLVGIARPTYADLTRGTDDEVNMQVSTKDVLTFSNKCASICATTCSPQECRLCKNCLSPSQMFSLKQAYLEHMNRMTWRRVFPAPILNLSTANQTTYSAGSLNTANFWMSEWFRGKCLQDITWCS